MNKLLKTNDEVKRRRCNRIIYKSMRITVDIHQNIYISVTLQPKNACKLIFSDHLRLPFLDQPQSEIVFFAIITFQVYNILVKK